MAWSPKTPAHALERAHGLDQTLIEPRILLAIAKEQDGQFAAAIDDWRAILYITEARRRGAQMVESGSRAAEAHLASKPVPGGGPGAAVRPTAPGQDGPSAGDVAAAQDMNPADRQAMIAQMVQRLAARLDQDGSDLPGWLKLVAPIACSTGRTTRRRRCSAPRASSAAMSKPSSSSTNWRPSLD